MRQNNFYGRIKEKRTAKDYKDIEEAKRLLEELKEKINSKPFVMTEPIDTTLKEDNDPFCLNLTTIDLPHLGSD